MSMAHWWNEWRENELLGRCRSAANVTSSWIGVWLDLGLCG